MSSSSLFSSSHTITVVDPDHHSTTPHYHESSSNSSSNNNNNNNSAHECWRTHFAESIAKLREDLAQYPVLGFDMEWTTVILPKKDGSKKQERETSKVALVQLATHNRCVVLRWCNIMPKVPSCETTATLLKDVEALLSHPDIVKVGAGIVGDRAKMKSDYNVDVEPFVELGVLRRHVRPQTTRLPHSLKMLAQDVCDVELGKDPSVTLSDWANGAVPLTPHQVQYAADDAVVSHKIAHTLLKEAGLDDTRAVLRAVEGKTVSGGRGAAPVASNDLLNAMVKPKSGKYKTPGEGWFQGRKKKYYSNIRVLTPDGDVVFSLDAEKANWYVNIKGIAKVTKWRVDPETQEQEMEEIQLAFTPNFGRYNDGHIVRNREYFKAPKENQCVVCGSRKSLVRHAVVPTTFRRRLPPAYVRHNSFDMVLVCTACFPKVTLIYDAEKRRQALLYGYHVATPEEDEQNRRQVVSAIRAAAALCRFYSKKKGNNLPEEREKELLASVASAVQRFDFTPNRDEDDCDDHDRISDRKDLLQRFRADPTAREVLDAVQKSDATAVARCDGDQFGRKTLGQHIIDVITANAKQKDETDPQEHSHVDYDIGAFIVAWRELFLREMQPKHLPKGWVPTEGVLLLGIK
eukprot:PhM_4_TR4719/c0_g1_i1/m.10056/K20777/EXD2; exonuclease 3'-5' domain-containing protein 2